MMRESMGNHRNNNRLQDFTCLRIAEVQSADAAVPVFGYAGERAGRSCSVDMRKRMACCRNNHGRRIDLVGALCISEDLRA